MKLLHAELTDKVIGCCIAVHKALGPGFLEKIYEEALCMELAKAGLKFERQKVIRISYDGRDVGEHRLDLFVEDTLVLELKAVAAIDPAHLSTTKSYLRAASRELALVVNFARPTLEVRRVILSK
jgi:GxxExxY protein